MFGDGITHGSAVSSAYISRRQPSIAHDLERRAEAELAR